MSNPFIHDVIIAGAGPVGLLLACELRLAGVSVMILEQAADPHSPLKELPFGMRGLSSPTLDALYRRGMLDELMASSDAHASPPGGQAADGAHWRQQARKPGGHFAGMQFFIDQIDFSAWPYRLPTPAPFNFATSMRQIESVLAERASAMGADIRRGIGVDGFTQNDDLVTVHASGETFHARWLVGCDGGRSRVRKAGGFEFAGTDPEFTGYSAQVEMADPDQLPSGRHYTPTGMYTYQKPGTIAMVDFDGGACHRSTLSLEHVQAVLRRVSCTDVTLTAMTLATAWTDRAMQASAYRNGRVLLAGDAAHVHSPLGGQGLNLGLGDAMNLGWKLAATLRGDAPAGLLDSYVEERHPVGAAVLDWSRAQVGLMRPSPASRALAAIVRDLIATEDGATYFARRIWGVALRYDLSGSHPLIGCSAPDFELADGRRAGELLRDGKGLLLDFDATAPLRSAASGWSAKVTYGACAAKDALGLRAVLIRPDGIVAWARAIGTDGDTLSRSLQRWFGPAEQN